MRWAARRLHSESQRWRWLTRGWTVVLRQNVFDRGKSGDKTVSIPFGKADCTVFRKAMRTEGMVQEFAPGLCTASQAEAFHIALQRLGDSRVFRIAHFGFNDARGYDRTARGRHGVG